MPGKSSLLAKHESDYMIGGKPFQRRVNQDRPKSTGSTVFMPRSPKFEDAVHIRATTRKKVPYHKDENLFFGPFFVHPDQMIDHRNGKIKSIKGTWNMKNL